jgi:hypothetical protein
MNTDEQIASLFYDASDHTDEPAEVEAPAQQDDVAATLFDTKPKEPEGLYHADDPLSESLTVDDLQVDAPIEDKQAFVQTVREAAASTGLDAQDVRECVGLARDLTANPAPAEQLQAEASKRLIEMAGGDVAEAERDLAMAVEFVTARPQLAAVLEATGLGNHPRVVELAVQAARRAKLRG